MIRIACFGESCVDINYIDGMIMPGGNSVNVAVYSSMLGHEAAYIGSVGDDEFGKLVMDSMDKFGIDQSRIKVVKNGETERCCCKLINGDRVLSMDTHGGVLYTDPVVLDEKDIEYFKSFDIIHANYWAYLDKELLKLKGIGVPIIYDFSQAGDEEKIAVASEFSSYMLFSAKKELTKEENHEMMRMAVDKYHMQMSIMTFGTEGAYIYDGVKTYYKEPYNAENNAVDTTGCGDSWISGFITEYTECIKRLIIHRETTYGDFLTEANISDYREHAIEFAMCVGNMRARATTQIKGAFGCGMSFSEFYEKTGIRLQ